MNFEVIILFMFIIIFVVFLLYVYSCTFKLPNNSPLKYLKKKNKDKGKEERIVICIGDSITLGKVSSNYVNMLSKRFENKNFKFINAGVNNEYTYNVLQRLDDIIACNPIIITLLIGTNDAESQVMSPEMQKFNMKMMKLPQKPDEKWFYENLTAIISILKQKTTAKIALLSIPPIGEDSKKKCYEIAVRFSKIIKKLSQEFEISYLNLFEIIDAFLKKNPINPKFSYDKGSFLMIKGVATHYLTGRSWDKISKSIGHLLHSDFVHLNDKGGKMVANLIENFILESKF